MKSVLTLLILSVSYVTCSVLHVPLTRTKIYKENLEGMIGTISLGTPPQQFRVFFDTMSAGFWVADDSCSDLEGRNAFNSTLSSTYEPVSGSLSSDSTDGDTDMTAWGSLGLDTLNIGGAQIEEVFFGMANQIQNYATGIDGVLGLAFQQIGFNAHTSSMEEILKSKHFSNKSISLYLSESSPALILGGVDLKYANSSFTYIPVIGDGIWSFIGSINVGSVAISNDIELIIDTKMGGPIWLPEDIFNNFLQVTDLSMNTGYQPDILESLRSIKIVTKSGTLTIPPSVYMSENEDGLYYLGFSSQNLEPTAVLLGSTFLGQHYTEFDYENKRIGFAEAANI